MTPNTLRIATRKSALALWQAEHVAALLRAAHPHLQVELVPMSTRGDEIIDRPLATLGGKGLFLKELEVAMQEGRAELAVHSLKDVPAELEAGFTLPAMLPRADAADAFVSCDYADLAALPPGARVGTSSLRRQAQLRAARPDLVLLDLRGNVGTRLAKLDAGHYDAIVLACAGLERLGLAGRIRSRLAAPEWLPAPGQAAIAIEARSDAAGRTRTAGRAGRRRDPSDRRRRARHEPGAGRQLHRAGRCLVRAYGAGPAPAGTGRRSQHAGASSMHRPTARPMPARHWAATSPTPCSPPVLGRCWGAATEPRHRDCRRTNGRETRTPAGWRAGVPVTRDAGSALRSCRPDWWW